MSKFSDIPQLPSANYVIDVRIEHVEEQLNDYLSDGLLLDPDFQRGHVWTSQQQIDFMEFIFRGGKAGDIYFNCPKFTLGDRPVGKFVLVDGKQRLTAIIAFFHNEIPVFGHYFKEYTDKIRGKVTVKFNIASLTSRTDVLKWYYAINAGGTPHSKEEMEKVVKLIENEDA